jgi:hypothetical protein
MTGDGWDEDVTVLRGRPSLAVGWFQVISLAGYAALVILIPPLRPMGVAFLVLWSAMWAWTAVRAPRLSLTLSAAGFISSGRRVAVRVPWSSVTALTIPKKDATGWCLLHDERSIDVVDPKPGYEARTLWRAQRARVGTQTEIGLFERDPRTGVIGDYVRRYRPGLPQPPLPLVVASS